MSKILVNAVGDACPIPVTKTIHALSGMTEAGTVEVHVDNETAVQNLNRLATGKGRRRPPAPRITGTTPWCSSAPTALAPVTIRWVPR